ncbi:MAG: NAD(P)/FAD-dependent oxidoreductase [Campylobacterales bacterium]|nr:NAD(P)/FAD-dependent oxidoreductase [Campylobacterales bacterium]
MSFDLIVVGAGPAGCIAAITAARAGKRVLLIEKLAHIGAKLKATGGGRCNLTNTLSPEAFIERFGKEARFMRDALGAFDHHALRSFFDSIGVATHAPDGYRVFPIDHKATTVVAALEQELERLHVTLMRCSRVTALLHDAHRIHGVRATTGDFEAPSVIIATGGLGYAQLGAEGDGYALAQSVGHSLSHLYPAMMPLHVSESWVAHCRADTIPTVTIRINLPKAKKITTRGDLIFTKKGIRGPVVLDVAREITPLLETHGEVPLLLNLTGGRNEEQIRAHIKAQNPRLSTLELLRTLLPQSLSEVMCGLSGAEPNISFGKQNGALREALIGLLAWTPLHVNGHEGFEQAMITRGGVSLREINPATMQSKKLRGLYFCGEVMDLDGPCGGYNLQWSFASGALAGQTLSKAR